MNAFAHYLEAKRTVDDRALDRRVLDRLRQELEGVNAPAIADVGAGIGAGIERFLDWGIVSEPRYTAVEENPDLVATARERLEPRITVEIAAMALAEFASDRWNLGRYDVVMAHAFLDIVALAPALNNLVALARPGGLLYFPITFDGESIFEPPHEDDDLVLARYHQSMNDPGSPKTGRRVFHALAHEPVDILEMGSSDWIVRPDRGRYPADEAFFLEFVLGMIEQTVGDDARGWAAARRQHVQEGRLLYIAHQLDYLARKHG